MEIINFFIDNYNLPVLTAFLLGILTAISPCPLATNITAIAYISKEIKRPETTVISGLAYTLGRAITYTLLAVLLFFGLSAFELSKIFLGWGNKILGPILILIGLVMLNVIKINFGGQNKNFEKLKIWLAQKGYFGSMLLGGFFALAFCPYSAVLFFGALMPVVLSSNGGLLLPIIFAIGSGLPVIFFSIIIAYSLQKMGKVFSILSRIEKWLRFIVASIFILIGFYYLKFTIIYLIMIGGFLIEY